MLSNWHVYTLLLKKIQELAHNIMLVFIIKLFSLRQPLCEPRKASRPIAEGVAVSRGI